MAYSDSALSSLLLYVFAFFSPLITYLIEVLMFNRDHNLEHRDHRHQIDHYIVLSEAILHLERLLVEKIDHLRVLKTCFITFSFSFTQF